MPVLTRATIGESGSPGVDPSSDIDGPARSGRDGYVAVATPAQDGRRRRAVVVIVGVAGVLAALWLAIPWWAVSYGQGIAVNARGEAGFVTSGFGDGGSHILDYVHGAEVVFSVPLRNDGPVAVTVRDVSLSDRPLSLVEMVEVRGLPLRLSAGEGATVTVVGRLDNCEYYHEREIQLFDGALVTTAALGRTTTERVSFDRPVVVHAPMIVGCPDGKLDRQFYDRSDPVG